MSFDLNSILRENIRSLTPYSSARDEFTGSAKVFLDANENPFPSGTNRYPDPYQTTLKSVLSSLKQIAPENLFIGNGSDEAIGLLIRATCNPGKDAIAQLAPTYGMYRVCADIQGVNTLSIPLTDHFEIDEAATMKALGPEVKILFACSPNNPTGNLLDTNAILRIASAFNGLVVVDEAYIDFADSESLSAYLQDNSNLVILQTLSKAWGLAGIRTGIAMASEELTSVLNKVKYPYNINQLSAAKALEVLSDPEKKEQQVATILSERERLTVALNDLANVIEVFPSDANFVLVRFEHARRIFESLLEKDIVVRDRSKVKGLENCLRITVGTPEENSILINAFK